MCVFAGLGNKKETGVSLVMGLEPERGDSGCDKVYSRRLMGIQCFFSCQKSVYSFSG